MLQLSKNQYILVILIDTLSNKVCGCFTERRAHDPSTNAEPVDSANIRNKVRHLKRMMEEKKQRRRSRRTASSPYHWARKQERRYKSEGSTVSDCLHPENPVPKDSYKSMEKETVAV